MENDVIGRLKSKIEVLISRYETLRAENETLRRSLEEKDGRLQTTEVKLKELEKEVNKLRLKEAFLGVSANPAQARKKVSVLIKEIDSCIAMLND
ncbi:MAG: hypothetical protein KBT00_01950 [Bacteroidales bacterium]|nr:hypothetical protein [Candidatus Cacconaster merdequi]